MISSFHLNSRHLCYRVALQPAQCSFLNIGGTFVAPGHKEKCITGPSSQLDKTESNSGFIYKVKFITKENWIFLSVNTVFNIFEIQNLIISMDTLKRPYVKNVMFLFGGIMLARNTVVCLNVPQYRILMQKSLKRGITPPSEFALLVSDDVAPIFEYLRHSCWLIQVENTFSTHY